MTLIQIANMNERIKELMKQADYPAPELALRAHKLAELIVQECILINRQRMFSEYEGDSHRVAHNNALFCANSDMFEHFGVEELPVCKHDWYSAKNPVVQNGSVCVICGAIDAREPEELKNERED